ncbi:MAG: family 16 glycosylhydrolase [Niabella sp.]
MKRNFYIIYLSVFTLFANCSKNSEKPTDNNLQLDESFVPASIKANYNLVWQDEFDGATLNLSKWNYRADGQQRTIGWNNRSNVSLNNKGQLEIKVTKDVSSGKYYTGMISTDGIFMPKYGYFECRAKMPGTIGPHSAFWLQSNSVGKTLNPEVDGTEIDIFEYHRKAPTTVHLNLHWNGYGVNHQNEGRQINHPSIGSGYHVFGLEWTDTEYVFYVDGVEKWRTGTALSKRAEYIILSTEVTGFGGDPALGTYPDITSFDYVRVYQKK